MFLCSVPAAGKIFAYRSSVAYHYHPGVESMHDKSITNKHRAKIALLGLQPDTRDAVVKSAGLGLELFEHIGDDYLLQAHAGWGLIFVDAAYLVASGAAGAERVRELARIAPCVVVARYDCLEVAIKAIQAGASDYLLEPVKAADVPDMIARLYAQTVEDDRPVCQAALSVALFEMARRVAGSNASVLLSGESGTGKEVLARYIHKQSPRASKPFVAVNCAAIPDTMLEATLFGYQKGAFTGATTSRAGKFEQANYGTLLLDEISEMPLELQAKILRVLQEREVERLGDNKIIPLDVRIIATTNRDLKEEVSSGRFREDLFYRLNVFPLAIHPLRDRPEDIIPLAEQLLAKHGGSPRRQLGAEAVTLLLSHQWPGNVRELENTMQRALILSEGPVIGQDAILLDSCDLPTAPVLAKQSSSKFAVANICPAATSGAIEPRSVTATHSMPMADLLRAQEAEAILDALASNETREDAARRLGISPRTLRHKLAKYRKEGLLQAT